MATAKWFKYMWYFCLTSSLNLLRCRFRCLLSLNSSSCVWQPQRPAPYPHAFIYRPLLKHIKKLHPACTLYFWLIVWVMRRSQPKIHFIFWGLRRLYFSRGASTMFYLINLVWYVAWYMRLSHTSTYAVRLCVFVCMLACCDKFVGNCEFSHFSKLFCQLSHLWQSLALILIPLASPPASYEKWIGFPSSLCLPIELKVEKVIPHSTNELTLGILN